MKIFIPFFCLIAIVLAEPPVGNGYPSARSSHDHSHYHDHSHDQTHSHDHENNYDQTNDFQRASNEYLPPAARSFGTSLNSISTEYGLPNAKSPSQRSGLSETYGAPNLRSGISQEYGAPSARSSAPYPPALRSLSTEYGVPSSRSSISQSYGVPAARNSLSQEYGAPVSSDIARTPSEEYGVPESRTPSEEYGVPSQRSFGSSPSKKYIPAVSRNSPFSRNSLSQEYGVPSARSGQFHQGHSKPSSKARSFASSSSRSYQGSSGFGARSLSTSYGAPSARNSGSYSQEPKGLYGAPSQRGVSDSYGAPSARGVSQEYGVPAGRSAGKKTSAIASSYTVAAARSSPSDSYGPPSARDSMPSEQYGAPDQYSNQGYSYARDGLNDVNQEPANYDFAYKVNDYESGSDFGHTETRQENRAEGSYFVVLPDGTKQIVEYEADERGFKPRISVEPADLGRSGGYDDNAAEIARSADGPY